MVLCSIILCFGFYSGLTAINPQESSLTFGIPEGVDNCSIISM